MKSRGHQRYISRIRGGGTPKGGDMNFGTLVDPMEVINHANFHPHLMSSFGAGVGQKTGFTFETQMALTTLPCATALASDYNRF